MEALVFDTHRKSGRITQPCTGQFDGKIPEIGSIFVQKLCPGTMCTVVMLCFAMVRPFMSFIERACVPIQGTNAEAIQLMHDKQHCALLRSRFGVYQDV